MTISADPDRGKLSAMGMGQLYQVWRWSESWIPKSSLVSPSAIKKIKNNLSCILVCRRFDCFILELYTWVLLFYWLLSSLIWAVLRNMVFMPAPVGTIVNILFLILAVLVLNWLVSTLVVWLAECCFTKTQATLRF
jgi:uncharacterized membrane protein (DUF485 family)